MLVTLPEIYCYMSSFQLPATSNSDVFEDTICDLFNSMENINTFKRFDKSGHKQKGIDIFSTEYDLAIQCKKKDLSRKDKVIKAEILKDIEKDVNSIINEKLNIKI